MTVTYAGSESQRRRGSFHVRTKIEVSDLTSGQWEWLAEHLPETREFGPNAVRTCVTFVTEVAGTEVTIAHVEMAPREFIGLMAQLQIIGRTAEAILTPDVLPENYVAQVMHLMNVPAHQCPCGSDGCTSGQHAR